MSIIGWNDLKAEGFREMKPKGPNGSNLRAGHREVRANTQFKGDTEIILSQGASKDRRWTVMRINRDGDLRSIGKGSTMAIARDRCHASVN